MKTLREELIDFADKIVGHLDRKGWEQTVDLYLEKKKSINSAPVEARSVSKNEAQEEMCHCMIEHMHYDVYKDDNCTFCGKKVC